MAKKLTESNKAASKAPIAKTAPVAAPSAIAKTTEVRNSPIPKIAVAKKEITNEMIAKRAYEIFAGGTGGSERDNWFRAERELRSGQ